MTDSFRPESARAGNATTDLPSAPNTIPAPSLGPLLVVGAFAPELAGLRGAHAPELDLREVGVGLVDAALGAQALLAERRYSGVVFVGTAGSIGSLTIGTLCVATECYLVAHRGEMPAIMTRPVGLEPSWIRAAVGFGFTPASVATTLGITTTAADAAMLAPFGLEHLEAFAVARAAERAQVPFGALLGVANIVGVQGRREWREHNVTVTAALAERALPLLLKMAALAAGVTPPQF
jgi:Phosphorylase superfamily